MQGNDDVDDEGRMERQHQQIVRDHDVLVHRVVSASYLKLLNARKQRGGARLWNNMLIVHLLRKVRAW
jgi:hypothetical protein